MKNQETKLVLLCATLIMLLFSLQANAQEPFSSAINLDITDRDDTNYKIEWEWSGSPPDRLIIVYNQFEENPTLPTDGQSYSAGTSFGSGKVLYDLPAVASDGVTPFSGINFSKSLLSDDGSDYWFTIYPYNTSGSNDYKTTGTNPFAFVTPGLVEEPYMQASNVTHTVGESDGSKRIVSFSYDPSLDELAFPYESRYLVVYKVGSEITYEPVDGSPNVTGDFELRTLSDGSKGRLDDEVETISVDVSSEEQTLYVKIFAFNKANFDQTVGSNWPSYNYLTTDPLEFTALIPAEPNSAPIIEDQTFTVNENSVVDTEVGLVIASDSDGDELTYTITNGNTSSAFSIDASGNVLVNNQSALDFETISQFALTISASDGNLSDDATITINVTNVNEAPGMTDATFSIDENSVNGTVVGQIVSSDPDGDALTYTITNGNTSSTFSIDASGNVLVNNQSTLDFETISQFALTINASDGNLSDDATITINVTNVNEAPSMTDATFSIDENSVNGTVVGQIVSSDPDGDALTYTIANGNTNDAFSIDASGNVLINNEAELDFETTPQFVLTVNTSDGNLSDDAIITINLNNLSENSGPTISNQSFTIIESIENGDDVGTIVAMDAQGDPITYVIESGNTGNAFSVNASSGMLSVNDRTALSFTPNASFALEILVSDGSNSNKATITIHLNNAPIFTWASTAIVVDENDNFSIAIPVTDAENDPLTLSISAASIESLVGISTDGTSIIPLSVGGLDYETHSVIDLIIEAADSEGNISSSETVTINITNQNDNAPTGTNQTLEIAQSASNGTVVATVVGDDADGDDLDYSMASGNTDNAFSIDPTTGEITVSNASALIGTSSFNLSIAISDGELSGSASISINIAENSAPTIVDQVFSLEENSINGTSVGTIIAMDNEDDALSFAIVSGNTNNAFLVVGSTGDILVINQEALDFEETPTFTLTVSVTDGKVSEVATITIHLIDVDETVLGFERPSEAISVYPNPATHSFSIDQKSKVNHVAIWDMNGKLIKSFDANKENKYLVSDLRSGLYNIMIKTGEKMIQSRLMIK